MHCLASLQHCCRGDCCSAKLVFGKCASEVCCELCLDHQAGVLAGAVEMCSMDLLLHATAWLGCPTVAGLAAYDAKERQKVIKTRKVLAVNTCRLRGCLPHVIAVCYCDRNIIITVAPILHQECCLQAEAAVCVKSACPIAYNLAHMA